MKAFRVLYFLCFSLCLSVGICQAEGWKVGLPSNSCTPPKMLVAVDKSRQKFHLLEFNPSTKVPVAMSLDCATGQNPGDKFFEGDLKTPEGVYFLTGTLKRGLDYNLYGSMAFTLNFPNPIDRLRGKTGHGIWIHGRGQPIEPMETRGCVALNDQDLRILDPVVSLGLTPAIIAYSVDLNGASSAQECQVLVERTQAWAEAWASKADRYFQFYDQAKFAQTQGATWAHYERRKRSLFARYPWIRVTIQDVSCLPGPDYMVTFFLQRYEAASFVSEGVKRLYWEKGLSGDWLIVGSEFIQADVNIRLEEPRILEAKDVHPWIEEWRMAWEDGRLDAYLSRYHDRIVRGKVRGKKALEDHWRKLWAAGDRPMEVAISELRVFESGQDRVVRFKQTYRSRSGYRDQGLKTLVLRPAAEGTDWTIVQEDWEQIDDG